MNIQSVAVIGLGLIGGSYAMAAKAKTSLTVWGYDADETVLSFALRQGIVDAEATPERLSEADLVLVCLYPEETRRFISGRAAQFKKGALVTDACGVKEPLCEELAEVAARHGFHFVGSHPMAGKERSGLIHASFDLFENANFLLTPLPGAEEEAVTALCDFARSVGFGRIVRCTPREHDQMIAFTSQLPHVLACAYVHSPRCEQQAAFSAGSYRDVSRVACINEKMWSSLFLLNAPALCGEIDTLMDNLQSLRTLIETGNQEELCARLRSGREIKEGYGA